MAFEHYQRMTNEALEHETNPETLANDLMYAVECAKANIEILTTPDALFPNLARKKAKEHLGRTIRYWVRLCTVLGLPTHTIMANDLSAWQGRDDNKTKVQLGIQEKTEYNPPGWIEQTGD